MPDFELPVPVLVIDDEPTVCARLGALLQGLGYDAGSLYFAATAAQARSHIAGRRFAFALVDIGLPDESGLQLIEALRAADPDTGILVISAFSTQDVILAALRVGATGYVLKERDDAEISLSIRSALRGGAPIDPFIARRLLALLAPPPPAAPVSRTDVLSPRETEILELVADGLTNREIAERLCLSPHTAACHIKNIYRKMAVSSRTRAVREARLRGLL